MRRDQLVEELLTRVGLPRELGCCQMEQRENTHNVRLRQREALLHHRLPSLQTRRVDLSQDLDVQQVVADLHVLAGAAEKIELVALLDAGRRQLCEVLFRNSETPAERAPLPSWNDRCHKNLLGAPCGVAASVAAGVP